MTSHSLGQMLIPPLASSFSLAFAHFSLKVLRRVGSHISSLWATYCFVVWPLPKPKRSLKSIVFTNELQLTKQNNGIEKDTSGCKSITLAELHARILSVSLDVFLVTLLTRQICSDVQMCVPLFTSKTASTLRHALHARTQPWKILLKDAATDSAIIKHRWSCRTTLRCVAG